MIKPFDTSAGRPDLRTIRAWLRQRAAALLQIEAAELRDQEPLSRYGLDSARALALTTDLASALGVSIPATLLFEHPSISMVLAHLQEGTGSRTGVGRTGSASESPAHTVCAEPIAIIGMACRLPQAADREAFWRLLIEGRDATTEIPADRWDVDRYYSSDPTAAGRAVSRRGAFLADVRSFDPLPFGISPREAIELDPHQRLLLELSIEALEDAGIPVLALRQKPCGVFLGSMWHDWADLTLNDLPSMGAHRTTGQATNMLANRVSYTLGLQGPSLVIDTACSSALVALHVACQALREGDADLALCGAANLLLSPASMVFVSKFGGLAPDGRCKPFGAAADGFGRGEGGGMLVLKRLSQARRDGDRIHSIVRATAVNNDGPSQGLTAPNPRAQEQVLRLAYRRAGLPLPGGRPQYVEAHGTGTPLGDPIEAQALGTVLGTDPTEDHPLWIGSAKGNIGHLEGAAGVVGLLKVTLAMQARQIPPSLHAQPGNPRIPFGSLGLAVPTEQTAWPSPPEQSAYAGVSAFGWGGTNAHVVLEGPPQPPRVLGLIATDDADLRQQVQAVLASNATSWPTRAAEDSAGRRLAIVYRTRADLQTRLQGWLDGADRPDVYYGSPTGTTAPRLAFVCSPLGSQWVGMGRQLLSTEPSFRAALLRCEAAFAPYLGGSILDDLCREQPSDRFDDVVLAQPLLFSVQVALASLLRSWGIKPALVIGHSAGEAAAAHIAGLLNLSQAAQVVHHYSRVQRPSANRGAMAVIQLPAADLQPRLASWAGRVEIAGINSPHSTVLSGDVDGVRSVVGALREQGILATLIRSNVAGHSPQMQPLLDDLRFALRGILPGQLEPSAPASVPMISTVTERWLTAEQLTGDYFADNLRKPVLLAAAVAQALQHPLDALIELGPHPVLASALAECVLHAGAALPVLTSLAREPDERWPLLQLRARLFALGAGTLVERETAQLVTVSGRSPAALQAAASRLVSWLDAPPADDDQRAGPPVLSNVAYSSTVRRSHYEHRYAVVARSLTDLQRALRERMVDSTTQPTTGAHTTPRIVFVFSGQGSQWPGMAQQLFQQEPVFRDRLLACEDALAPYLDRSLTATLFATDASQGLQDVAFVQPALWAIQVALATLLRSWDIVPSAVLGHSMGEVAAACVAQGLDLSDAAQVIALRSRLARDHASGRGAMALVELSRADAEVQIAPYAAELSLAATSGPRSCVLSGDSVALERVLSALTQQGVFCRRIQVDYASHSPHMDVLRPLLEGALASLRPQPPQIPMLSSVSADWLARPLCAEYWADNLRKPVLFAESVARLAVDHDVFIEISPHPVLIHALKDCAQASSRPIHCLGTLRRDEDQRACLLQTAASLYEWGAELDHAALHPEGARLVDLPSYPWQRERLWPDAAIVFPSSTHRGSASPSRNREQGRPASAHPLLGPRQQTPLQPRLRLYEHLLQPPSVDGHASVGGPAWLAHHRVGPACVVPAAAWLDLVLTALAERSSGDCLACTLTHVRFPHALLFASPTPTDPCQPSSDSDGRTVQLAILGGSASHAEPTTFQISSRPTHATALPSQFTLHAVGEIDTLTTGQASAPTHLLGALLSDGPRPTVAPALLYETLARCGLHYGPSFQGIRGLEYCDTSDGFALRATVVLPASLVDDPQTERHVVHPALLDACLHALCVPAALRSTADLPYVPVGIDRLTVHAAARSQVVCLGRLQGQGATLRADVCIEDTDGRSLITIDGLQLRALPQPLLSWSEVPRAKGVTSDSSADGPAALADARDSVDGALLERTWVAAGQATASDARAASPTEATAAQPGRIVLLTAKQPASDVVLALAAQLRGAGHDVLCEPTDAAGDWLTRVLTDGTRCQAVVFCGGLGLPVPDALDARRPADADTDRRDVDDSLAVVLASGCAALLPRLQELLQAPLRDLPRLWIVTSSTQSVTGREDLSLWQTPLWGLAQTLRYEHPELPTACVDLGGRAAQTEAIDLAALLGADLAGVPTTEDQWALRPEGRFVARLRRRTLPPALPPALRPDATYWISGGLGGLGLALAGWLADCGARHVTLISRRGLTREAQHKAVASLMAGGLAVQVAVVDVAQEPALRTLLAQQQDAGLPLAGVFHAAAVLDDAVLLQQDADRLRRVLHGKALGALALHRVTRAVPLDCFVLYASAASLIGSPGQANYAAANAFLDGLARLRQSMGLPALSISWGAFAGVGLAAALDIRGGRLAQRGLGPLSVDVGHQILARALAAGISTLGAVPLDLRQWTESYPTLAGWPLLSLLQAEQPGADTFDRAPLRQAVLGSPPTEQLRTLLNILQAQLVTLLRVPPERIGPASNLIQLGLDSLIGLELRNRLEAGLGLRLSATLAWTYPQLDALAEFLVDELRRSAGSSELAVDPPNMAVDPSDRKTALPARPSASLAANPVADASADSVADASASSGEFSELSDAALLDALARELDELNAG